MSLSADQREAMAQAIRICWLEAAETTAEAEVDALAPLVERLLFDARRDGYAAACEDFDARKEVARVIRSVMLTLRAVTLSEDEANEAASAVLGAITGKIKPYREPDERCHRQHTKGTECDWCASSQVNQRDSIAEVQQVLYDRLIAPIEHGSMKSDDDADLLIKQAEQALGLAWKLADA